MDILAQLEEIGRPTVEKKPWMESVELILGTRELLPQIIRECIEAKRFGLDLETTGLDQRAFPTDSGRLETVDKIVGFCLSPSKTKSYYIPVRHRGKGADSNVPPRLVRDAIVEIQAGGAVAVFHNAKFDIKFLLYDPVGQIGEWDDQKMWEDTQLLAYLRDSRQRQKGLKYLSETMLERKMIELEDLFSSEDVKAKRLDFSSLEPTWPPTVWYAASDALNTLALYDILAPQVYEKDKFKNGQKTICTIEKMCITATIWMEQCRIFIDRPKLISLIQGGQKEWWEALKSVYQEVGEILGRDVQPNWMLLMEKEFKHDVLDPDYMDVRGYCIKNSQPNSRPTIPKSVPSLQDPKVRETVQFVSVYDITIPAQLGMMLRELGVTGLKATEKSGQVATDADTLDEVIQRAGEQFSWMKKIKWFREIAKSLGGMLFNLYRDTEPPDPQNGKTGRSPDGCVWANFNGLKTDTGRFSTPTPREGAWHGQANWNVQSTTAAINDPKDPSPECCWRQREVIAARPGFILFAIDYSGVELRIVTNLSGEPKWLTEFFHCSSCDLEFDRGSLPPPFCPKCGSDKIGDLHTLTAFGIYGEQIKNDKNEFKIKRGIGKIVNFLLCYGGSGTAVMHSVKCDKEEGWRIKNQFDKTYTGLLRWWKIQHRVAKEQKYVTTVYGRKYPVPDIDHEIMRFKSKAERNAVNGPVQGSSADIMKFAMGLIYREVKKRGWLGKVLLNITIHDELVFEVHESIVGEAIPVLERIMCVETTKNLGWAVPLKVDIEFGPNWTVKNNLTEMTWNKGGKWTPRLAEVFPDRYANYLRCGGVPVEGFSPPETPQSEPQMEYKVSVAQPEQSPVTNYKVEEPSEDERPKESSYSAPEDEEEGDDAAVSVPAAETRREPAPAAATVTESSQQKESAVEKNGTEFVFKIPSHKLLAENAEKLARVVSKCAGKGLDVLRVTDENGVDLLGGSVKVAMGEFRILIDYEFSR